MARDREQGLRVARSGAASFGLDEDSFRLIRDAPEGDGLVYEAMRGGSPAILKVAQAAPEEMPTRRAKAAFSEYLNQNGAAACEQFRSRNGELVEAVTDGESTFALAAFRRAPGRGLDLNDPAAFTPQALAAWGRALGRFHALARAYPLGYRYCPADRPSAPDPQRPLSDWRDEHAFFARWPVTEPIHERWLAVGEQLAALPQPPEAFGLIHNDMGPNNLLWDGVTLTVIDFDVAGYSWFISDVASGLYSYLTFGPTIPEQARPAAAAEFVRPLLAAYHEEHTLDRFWLERLPLFLEYRQLLLCIVFTVTWGDHLRGWQQGFLSRLTERVVRGVPVLDLGGAAL